jgi:transposase
MPAPLRVVLPPEEEEMLSDLRVATTVPQRTRDRAHMLRLNFQGWNVPAIAEMFECHDHTVRATIRRWQEYGLLGLWEAPGRGAKPPWTAEDMKYIETCLADETRTYNSAQLVRKLKEAGLVDLSRGHLRTLLKKNYCWKRTRQSHRQKQDPVKWAPKQAELAMLKQAAAAGEIVLKYLDESGFCLWSPVSYSLVREHKRMEQTKPVYGWRISILGLWQKNVGFEYGLAKG